MIPLSTTTISVLRTPVADIYDEPYDGSGAAERDVIATGVRAVIDRPSGIREQVQGAEQSVVELWLTCDPVDMTHMDLVRDDTTGQVYGVRYVISYLGSHVEAGLRITEGVV